MGPTPIQEVSMPRHEPHEISRRRFLRLLGAGGACLSLVPGRPSLFPAPGKEENPILVFGAVADAQYADAPPKGTRFYRRSPAKLARAVKELDRHDLDFSIHLGDFIDRDFRSFDKMVPIWNSSRSPAFHVLGNHDFQVKDAEKARVVERLGLDILGPGKGYYSFRLKGWRFLVLNGNASSLQAHPKGSRAHQEAVKTLEALKRKKAPNAMPWNGALGKAQWAWLRKELDRAAGKKEKVILFSHFPVYPPNVHNQWDDKEVVKLLDGREEVFAWIDGHNHAGNYGFHGGVHYLNLPGMVETKDTTAFARIEIHRDYLKVVGYGRTPSRKLPRGEEWEARR